MEKQNSLKGKIGSLFQKKPVRYGFAFILIGALSAGGYFLGKPVAVELKDSAAAKSIHEKGVLKTYADALFSIIHKLSDLEKLDRTNAELNKKLAILEKEYEAEKSKNVHLEAKEVTETLSEKLKGEAGSELARVLQSIEYQPPSHLLPHQQYALALGYFRKQEYEQAAVLFTYLTELKEDVSYQRPEVYLMNAISWFKLSHFKLSSEYVKKTIKKSDEDTSVHRKAILWQALLAKAQGNVPESQRINFIGGTLPTLRRGSMGESSRACKLSGKRNRKRI